MAACRLMKRIIVYAVSAALASVGALLEQSRLTAFWEAQAAHHSIGDQLSMHEPADVGDKGDEPKPPPLQVSATFEGGLRGDLNAEVSLGPPPSDNLAS